MIRAAKAEYGPWIKMQPGCNGVGVGVDDSARPCLKIFTSKMDNSTKSLIEEHIGSLNVQFEEMGVVEKR